MRVVYIGNFTVSYSTESHLANSLEALGHSVLRLQENTTNTNEVLKEGLRSDLLMWSHTHGWRIRGRIPLRTVMRNLKRRNIPTVAYHLDLWLGLERQRDLRRDEYWYVEHFFTVDKLMAERLNASPNMPTGYYLPAGVYEPETKLGKIKKQYQHDVIFVGSRIYHRQWQYRTKLIGWLEQTYGKRFALYGKDGKGLIRGQELNDLYHSSKIVIGDTLCLNFDYPYYLSDRVFETTGRGGFIIHPYIKGIRELFTDDELVTYDFNNFEQLQGLIDYYLEHDEEREAIRTKGWQRTKLEHTYTKRLQTIINTLGLA
jgi:hypothetical protein